MKKHFIVLAYFLCIMLISKWIYHDYGESWLEVIIFLWWNFVTLMILSGMHMINKTLKVNLEIQMNISQRIGEIKCRKETTSH